MEHEIETKQGDPSTPPPSSECQAQKREVRSQTSEASGTDGIGSQEEAEGDPQVHIHGTHTEPAILVASDLTSDFTAASLATCSPHEPPPSGLTTSCKEDGAAVTWAQADVEEAIKSTNRRWLARVDKLNARLAAESEGRSRAEREFEKARQWNKLTELELSNLRSLVQDLDNDAQSLDLFRDEFLRIKAISDNPEVIGLCERAVSNITQHTPILKQRDTLASALKEAEQERDEARKDAEMRLRHGNGLFLAIIERMKPYYPENSRDLEWDVLPGVIACALAKREESQAALKDTEARLGEARSAIEQLLDPEYLHALWSEEDSERSVVHCVQKRARAALAEQGRDTHGGGAKESGLTGPQEGA